MGCFAENTLFVTENFGTVKAKHLKVGDFVLTLSNQPGIKRIEWTQVTKNEQTIGDFQFKKLVFNNGNCITVTIEHQMLVVCHGKKIVKQAKQVIVGNEMLNENGETITVTSVETFGMDKKYDITTDLGTAIADSVFVNCVCGQV